MSEAAPAVRVIPMRSFLFLMSDIAFKATGSSSNSDSERERWTTNSVVLSLRERMIAVVPSVPRMASGSRSGCWPVPSTPSASRR